MIAMIFLLAALTAAWWYAVWLLLPINLAAFDAPSLVALHAAPPVLAVLVWLIGKRTWQWNKARKKKAREDEQAAQKEAERVAQAAAREEGLAHRRAYFVCRAAWLAVPDKPDWFMDELPQCQILEQDADTLRGSSRGTALTISLRSMFDTALSQCGALAFLPLYLLPGREDDLELVRKTWQEALTAVFPEAPPAPECRLLPDTDEPLTGRILTLFENEPAMPAMWLLGMDSLLEGATDSAPPQDRAGTCRRRPHIEPPKPCVSRYGLHREARPV